MHFLNIFLPCLPLIRCLTTPNPLMLCDDVLKAESKDMWTNIASLSSIFYHVFKTGCLICTKQKCRDSRKLCSRQSEVKIPMYNNLFEFGLSGKYFPESGSIKINYKSNDTCYLRISLTFKPERKIFGLNLYQCYSHTYDTGTICQEESKRIEYLMDISNEFCLYFGLAFYDADKVHLTSSPYCNKFASDKFDYHSEFYTLKKRSCYFNKTVDKPEATFELFQSEKRNIDGVPIILPCSPGGFVVDPKTGRFVINETCWKMFSDSKRENVGINFLINKMYNGNENLLFPQGDYRTKENFKPIYISDDGKAKSRESMAFKVETNKKKGNKIRVICEYLSIDDIPYISATLKPQTPSYNKNGTTVPTPRAVTRNPRGVGSQPCSYILKDLKPTRPNEEGEGQINAYVHGESACFACAEPTCNYKLKTCPLQAELQLQVYNNLFEFGLSGKYMPESGHIRLDLNKNCYIKIEMFVKLGNISFHLQECRSTGDKKKDHCADLRVDGFEDRILFNNWYCAQIALALHVDNKIFYGFSFRCDKFASSQLNESKFQWLKFEECYKFRHARNVKVNFTFNQGDLHTHEGVPIMLPCSSGGYAVDSKIGRFAINQTCDDMFWETIVNSSKSSGIHFIIKHIYQNNENLLFKSRKDAETKYPSPIYMKSDRGYESFQYMLPTIKNNTEKWKKLRQKCLYTRSADSNKFKNKTKLNKSGTGKGGGGDASKATKFQLPHSELILIFLTLMKCQ
ncbi:UNVERIFIED_CONTAM: hypothetical protein RMT77_013784 [Armadillidium vulgare]